MSSKKQFHGVFTALITPFTETGIDIAAFEAFIDWQISEGVHGIVPCGTTGESPTLSHAEHKSLIQTAVKAAGGRVAVMAGTGSNSTAEAIEFTKHAEIAGADAALVVAPYYNKPTQEGLFQHYKAIANATALPIFIYNIPGRSVINLTDATIARLAEACPNIAGVKDATGDLARIATLKHLVGDRLILLSGEDMTMVGYNAMGGQGVISVISNLLPHLSAKVQKLTLAGEFIKAREAHAPMVPLINALFTETNPIPVKFAASLMHKCATTTRLPLVSPSTAVQEQVRSEMAALGLI
jgi:4-hydroxy-tetrahydrodipicolinate synthase